MENDDLEEWVAWIKRSTRIAEEIMVQHNVPDWVREVHRRRYQWAGQVSRSTDGRWTKQVLKWSCGGTRARGRPKIRWTDNLNNFFGDDKTNVTWSTLAEDEAFWNDFEEQYVNFVLS